MKEGYRILYWAETRPADAAHLIWSAFVGLLTGTPWRDPKDFVNPHVSERKRQLVAKLLAGGQVAETYMGDANCRICGARLGNKDLAGYGFIWPEKAEHYLLEHDVWTFECDLLFDAARRN